MNKKKYTFNEAFFEVINSERKAYWLGFIAADGNLSINPQSKKKRVILSQAEKDKDLMFRFINDLNYLGELKQTNSHGFLSNRVILVSNKLYDDLIDKGITPRKSLTLKPPKNVPKDLIRHWIRGYFDGDGCVSFGKKHS